jgi:hypothetical protein
MLLRGRSSLLTADFYRAFEDKHRGARELIKSRLRVYPVLAAARGDAFRLFSLGLCQRQAFALSKAFGSMTYDQALNAASNAEGDALIAKVPRCAGQSFQCCGRPQKPPKITLGRECP